MQTKKRKANRKCETQILRKERCTGFKFTVWRQIGLDFDLEMASRFPRLVYHVRNTVT